jgi:hypothetical protein
MARHLALLVRRERFGHRPIEVETPWLRDGGESARLAGFTGAIARSTAASSPSSGRFVLTLVHVEILAASDADGAPLSIEFESHAVHRPKNPS